MGCRRPSPPPPPPPAMASSGYLPPTLGALSMISGVEMIRLDAQAACGRHFNHRKLTIEHRHRTPQTERSFGVKSHGRQSRNKGERRARCAVCAVMI